MQLDWQGYYLDGRTPTRHKVAIRIFEVGLFITTESGTRFFWFFDDLRQTQGFNAREQVRLERDGGTKEALLVPDREFLTSLPASMPQAPQEASHLPKRAVRLRIPLRPIIFAALAVAALPALLYLRAIPFVAAFMAARMPVSREERLGRRVFERLAPEEKRCSEPARMQRIDKILAALLSPLPQHAYKFRLFVVDDPTLNAFAAPGGTIVVFRGLLEATQTAEELAGLLAHEIGHTLERHSTQQLLQHAPTGVLVSALFGDASGATGFGLDGPRTLGLLRYGRSQEEEADVTGVALLISAKIDPAGTISFFEAMKKNSGSLTYLSTHSATENRSERLKSLAALSGERPARLLPTYNWKDIRRICPATDPGQKGR